MQNFQVNDLVSWSDGTVKQYGRIEAVLSKAARIETEWGNGARSLFKAYVGATYRP